MINAKSWDKIEKGVALTSAAMIGVVFMIMLKAGPIGIGLGLYMGYEAVAAYRRDHLDERERMISARAGYLSQKLMIAAGLLLACTPGHGDAQGAVMTILLLGALSESLFRRLQGGQTREPAPAWLWAVVIGGALFFAWGILAVFRNIAESFDLSLWQMLKLLYNGSPN